MHSDDLKTKYSNWRDSILSKAYNPTIIPDIFMRPEILHFTIIRLPLRSEEKVEACRQMMKNIEPKIKQMIQKIGGKLKL